MRINLRFISSNTFQTAVYLYISSVSLYQQYICISAVYLYISSISVYQQYIFISAVYLFYQQYICISAVCLYISSMSVYQQYVCISAVCLYISSISVNQQFYLIYLTCCSLRLSVRHVMQLLYFNCLYWCLLLGREFSLKLSTRPCNGLFSFNLVLRTSKKVEKKLEMCRECELCQFVLCCFWFVLRIVSM
jgi:hypothetical protein